MKVESEVSISCAISIFSNEKFTPDDYRLTYKSYEELGLICENCRELVFFKQGIERVSHFSHFKSTGKNCEWRRRTSSNSNTQHTDSESREQSLEKFQNKFKGIIERAIIQYHNISSPQFLSQIVNGKILVAEYNINIEAWLRWFNKKKNRNKVENVALALYQNNELLSDINSRVILNLLDYLCVSASKDILRDILYYVVFVLNKEIGVNNDFEKVCCKVIEIIIFADWKKEYEIAPITFKGIDHPNVEEKTPKGQIKVEQQTPKPIKLENEKVVTGTLKFVDVIGTVPAIMKLNPSLTGYTLTALPVKLPDNYCYDIARYIAGNVPKFSAINYLHDQVKYLQSLSCDKFGGIPRTALISILNNLLEGVITDKKIDPQNFMESKNKLREYLNNAPFLTSTRDQYYGFYELAKIAITQEVEDQEYQYRLTNLSPDDKAFYRHNLPSVLNWVRRVTYNLRNYFGVKRPDTGEIRHFLQSTFNYSNCKLNIYYGDKKPRKGLIMEISHRGQIISEHHIQIIEPANLNPIYQTTNEEGKKEEHARHYGIVPTTISISPSFNDYNDDAIFYAFLKSQKTDKELVTFAKAQLSKVINKYISANRNKLVGENKSAVQVTVAKSVGFIDTGHGYNAIKKTFLKFLRPFTFESAVNMGKVVDLKTLKPYSEHDSTFLLEKITANWKKWDKKDDRTIELGNQQFRKENPAKLMINVHNLIQSNPELTSLVWDDLINTFYQLSGLSLGFKANNSVILTPWDIYDDDVQRWQHRIKIQLISILKDGDKTRTLGIESLLQRDIYSLYSLLNRLQPGWNNNEDINKHLQALHDTLAAEGDNEAIPEILDTVEETQNHLESSSEVVEVNPEITQPIDTTGEVSQVLEVIPENVEEITDPISHSSEVIEVKEETEQKLESNKVKPYLLDGSKAVSGQLVFKGMLGTVPCIFKMVPSGRLYDIQALPIKCNQLAVAQYVVGNYPNLTSIAYLDRTIEKYQNMKVAIDKLREKADLITRLESLLRDVNSGVKIDPSVLLTATQTIEKYLDKADYKPIVGDSYYRFHNLGTGQFIQQVNTERYQYIVKDYGKNFRRGTGSDINSVINWVRNCSSNLNTRFGHKAAEIGEIAEYLEKSFKDRFPSKNVQLAVYERGQKFLEIYYKGGLEIQQLISIISPSTAKKETNLIATNTNFLSELGTDREFQQFLQCSEFESALIISTKEQVKKMVQKYIRSNYLTLTGENKIFQETKIAKLVGFNQSDARYGGIIKTFLKYVRPYLDQSAPNILKGELINLDNLKTYNEKDANNLIGAITNQWKNWKHKDQETIKLGESIVKKPDPGTLMLSVTAALYQNPNHNQIIWRDLIDVFYQLSELPIGFRASNGVVLTPHSFYESGVTRHTHRIKVQLIDLLHKEQKKNQDKAHNALKLAASKEDKERALEQTELVKKSNPGSIEAWLTSPLKKLYSHLEKLDPQWKVNLANSDILKHLAAMHDALALAIKSEANP